MQQGAEAMAQGAGDASQQMTQGLQQMAQGFQQMAQGSATPVDYEALKALLPDVSGWTQSDARGEQVSMPMKFSRAEARYTRDGGRVQLEIVDSALSQMLLAPMTMFPVPLTRSPAASFPMKTLADPVASASPA